MLRKTSEMDRLQKQIEENHDRARMCKEQKEKKDEALKSVLVGLQGLYLCINPLAIPENDALVTLHHIETELTGILKKIDENEIRSDAEEKVSEGLYFSTINC
ncbi:hypothetical protein NQ314_009047 [Rhamnusium bicolor]|uniref:Uncharacterized protein n=1 Tax=Rhamnusium bicolor TaxID=1586634 RepID=A0AAV8Y5U6_9CUCU|nr:hypothetical protein NQ314_009047 [Rhamnusium bicolor]